MKKYLISTILSIVAYTFTVNAQITKATLQASGLTCSMCSNAINKRLAQINYIEKVASDIKSSSFIISFKEGSNVNIDELQKAVSDAGFSIAALKITMKMDNIAIKNDAHIIINNEMYHFVNVESQTLQGNNEFTVIDKKFLPTKAFKKYQKLTTMPCYATGKTAACCKKENLNSRIIHLTI